MKLERWRRQLKHEAGGTVMKRLDKTISLLLAAIVKKLLSRVISIERGKLTCRVALFRKRHKGSEEMDNKHDYIQCDEKRIVTKSEGSSIFTYDILEGNRSCRCPIRRLATNTAYNPHSIDINQTEQHQIGKNAITSNLHKASMDSVMNAIITKCEDIGRLIRELKSIDQAHYVKEAFAAIKIHLKSTDNATNLPSLPPVQQEMATAPSNKNIDQQRKFIKKNKGSESKTTTICKYHKYLT
ncbi:uncharacterized protein TNIN_192071 [Trichonephila inaurata madagascariensis]|uniref:Uncharacterized protein n=1 Tax=Trichonephila inaurata madagascariensis TaxID=2747483 RepID=A0A8X6IDL8_9ARAC|nr:uncharacterized protein TNIN_192071 [Trichonephila inaurata madagascariensis]